MYKLHRQTVNNLILNGMILCSAYSFWYSLSMNHIIQQSITVPVVWYDLPSTLEIACQDNITIEYSCKRSDMPFVKNFLKGIYLSGEAIEIGAHEKLITKDNFFVPDTIKLVDCRPSLISFTVQEKKI